MYLQGEVKDSAVRDLPRQESTYESAYSYPAPHYIQSGTSQSQALSGEVKDNSERQLVRQQEQHYAHSTTAFLRRDQEGRHYYDLNDALQNYRGAWLFGQEHVDVMAGGLRARWEQFCPVPADVPDGVLLVGNVIYRQPDGSWRRSPDRFQGEVVTQRGSGMGRYFLGKTEHTFYGQQLPQGALRVVADLRVHLAQVASHNSLVPISTAR